MMRVAETGATRPTMADLVQRYLDALVAEFACVTDGALADYIPGVTEVDPTGFGLTLSAADGFLYESGDARNRIHHPIHLQALHLRVGLDLSGPEAVDAKIGVEPSGDAFNEISVDEQPKRRRTR